MAAPITAGAQQNDFTTRLVVGAHYDWSNGLIIPNPRPGEGEANSTPYIDRVVWRHPHVSGAGRAHWDLLTFPPPTRDRPRLASRVAVLQRPLLRHPGRGNEGTGDCAGRGSAGGLDGEHPDCDFSRWRDIRFKETRQLIFLPEDITEAPADHRAISASGRASTRYPRPTTIPSMRRGWGRRTRITMTWRPGSRRWRTRADGHLQRSVHDAPLSGRGGAGPPGILLPGSPSSLLTIVGSPTSSRRPSFCGTATSGPAARITSSPRSLPT